MKYFIVIYFGYVLLTILLSWPLFGLKFYSLVSNSMAPQLSSGSLIVIKKESNYVPNDIIGFYAQVEGREEIVVHRIVDIGGNVYVTRGDANQNNDRLLALPRLVIGRVVAAWPLLGYLLGIVNYRWGNFAVVILPAIIIVGYEIQQVIALWPIVFGKKSSRIGVC